MHFLETENKRKMGELGRNTVPRRLISFRNGEKYLAVCSANFYGQTFGNPVLYTSQHSFKRLGAPRLKAQPLPSYIALLSKTCALLKRRAL